MSEILSTLPNGYYAVLNGCVYTVPINVPAHKEYHISTGETVDVPDQIVGGELLHPKIVRCGKCKYRRKTSGFCCMAGKVVEPDFFCRDGSEGAL